jgi:hypothetical protein
MKPSAILSVVVLLAGGAGLLSAQERPARTFDMTAGPGVTFSGRYDNSDVAAAGELTLARRIHPATPVTSVLALTVGGQVLVSRTDVCVLLPGGACTPDLPSLYHVGVLGGSEYLAVWLPVRVLAGPAVYFGEGRAGAGAQVQLDVATPTLGRVALVLSGRGSYVARFDGERLQLGTVGLGLRLQ